MVTFIELSGLGLVAAAAFMMNVELGLLVMGLCLIIIGVALDRR
jgi:hypothetical membrane protein